MFVKKLMNVIDFIAVLPYYISLIFLRYISQDVDEEIFIV